MIHLKPDSLAFSLRHAAQAVVRVRQGAALPQALTFVFAQTPTQAHGAIQDLAYRSMRQWGRVDALLVRLTHQPPKPALLQGLLCCALALMADPDPKTRPYHDFTVVDQAVSAAASDPAMTHAKGMVNAVLRRFLRERDTLLPEIMQDPVARWNYPAWWIRATQTAYPNHWQTILQVGNSPPPLTLRVNRRQSTVPDYLQQLATHSMAATQIGPDAVRLAQPLPVRQIPGFAQGKVSVQDAAAQLAAPLLDVQDGMRVLDACAAPGGKTGHLLECAHIDLIALDNDAQRLTRIEENLQRLQLSATLKLGDASTTHWWDGQCFDRILVDVPCTASGIVRRHPDIRWLRRPEDAEKLTTLSARILDNLWKMLHPNGKLLFVTCSLWPQESETQASAFTMRHPVDRLSAPGQLLPTISPDADHDGLFYALFHKPAHA